MKLILVPEFVQGMAGGKQFSSIQNSWATTISTTYTSNVIDGLLKRYWISVNEKTHDEEGIEYLQHVLNTLYGSQFVPEIGIGMPALGSL